MFLTSLARLGALSALLALPAFGQVTINPVPVQTSWAVSPNPYKIASAYAVTVDDGTNTPVSVDTHVHIVDYPGSTTDHTNVYYTHFSFGGGSVNVHVTLSKYASNCVPSSTYNVTVSPTSYGINPALTTNGNVVSITLKKSRYVMLKVDDLNYVSKGTANPYPYYLLIFADPLETDKPGAARGTGIYNVTDSPYLADKTFVNGAANAIGSAVQDASSYGVQSGGYGTVYIPAGVYRIDKPIAAQSHVHVYMEPGAYLKVTENVASSVGSHLYIFDEPGSSDGSVAITDFKIYGRGTLDANGIAAANYPSDMSAATVQAGPIRIRSGTNITLDGIVLREANAWSIAFDCDDTVKVLNTKVVNYTQDFTNWRENDGFDLAQCSNSIVSHGFVFTADDAVCFKGDNGFDANTGADQLNTPHTNNIMYDLVLWTGADGCRFGGEMRDPVSYSFFKNIDIVQAQRAIAVHATEGGGTFDHIGWTDIRCERLDLPPKPLPSSVCRPIDLLLQISNSPQVTNLRMANVGVPSAAQFSDLVGDSNSSFNGVEFCNVSVGSVTLASTNLNQVFSPDPATATGVANISYPPVDFDVTQPALAPGTNWSSGYPLSQLYDNNTSTQARGVTTADAIATFPVKNMMVTSVRVWKPAGTYTFSNLQVEARDPATGTWTTLLTFANGAVTTTGQYTIFNVTPTMADEVKLSFRQVSGGVVGVNEARIWGH